MPKPKVLPRLRKKLRGRRVLGQEFYYYTYTVNGQITVEEKDRARAETEARACLDYAEEGSPEPLTLDLGTLIGEKPAV